MSRIVVGAQVLCFINGMPFAHVTSVRFSSPTPHVARKGIDSIIAFELSPVGAACAGSLSMYRLSQDGGLEGRGIVAPFAHIPREKYFSLLVIDRKTGQKLIQADLCKVTAQEWSVAVKGRMEGSFSFEGIEWNNEAEY